MEVPACGMVHLQTRITESCSFYYALCTWWKEAGRKEKYKNVAHSNSKIFQPCLFLYSPKHITAAVFFTSQPCLRPLYTAVTRAAVLGSDSW